MADRNLSAAALTELAGSSVEFYHLIHFDFSTPLYYTTAPRDIVYATNTYISNAIVSKIPDFNESLKIKPQTITLDFSGAAQSSHALPLTSHYKNVEVYIYRYLASSDESFLVFKGFIDSYESVENIKRGTSKVSWKITNHWADWDAVNGRLLTDENQQELFPGDLGLQFTGVTEPVLDYWGDIKKWKAQLANTNPNAFGQQTSTAQFSPGSFAGIALGYGIFTENLRDQSSLYDWESLAVSAGKLPVVYGEASISGTPVFRDLSGASVQYLSVVYALSEGECDSLTDVLFDGVSYTDVSISGKVSVTFHSGSDSQVADATLVTDSVEWTSAHRLRGICYAVVKYTYDKAIWSGEPTPQFILKAKKCTPIAGGAAVWTDDFVTITQDYATSSRYGKGLLLTELDNFAAGSTYATALVTDHDGGDGGTPVSIQRFAFNGVIDTVNSIKKNIESILSTGLASLPWVNGKYKLVIQRDDDTASFTFDADNITDSFKVKEAGIKSYANSVYFSFIDTVIDYAESTVFTTLDQTVIDAEDNGRVLRKNTGSKYENNRYRAQNRSNTLLKLSRDPLSCSIVSSKADSIRNETGDVVNVTRDTQGWVNKKFRITDMTMLKSGGCKFELAFYDPTNLQWAVNAEFNPPANTSLTNPLSVTAPTTLVLTDDQNTTGDGSTLDRIKVSFTLSSGDSFIDHYEVWYKTTDDTEYTKLTDLEPDENVAYLNVTPDKQYDFQVYAANALSVRSTALSGSKTYGNNQIIGTDVSVNGADDIYNNTFYYKAVFESPDGYVLDNALSTIDNSPNSLVVYPGGASKDVGSLIKEFSTINDFNIKAVFKISSGTGQYLYRTMNQVSTSISLAGGLQKIGLGLIWNNATSKIDIYAYRYDKSGSSTQSSLITSINDTGIEVTCDIVKTGNSMIASVIIGGTTYTSSSINATGSSAYILFAPMSILVEEETIGTDLANMVITEYKVVIK